MKPTERLLRFSQNTNSIVGFLLIFLFLGLGSCPFKKARLVLLEDSFKREQTLKEFGLENKLFTPGKGPHETISQNFSSLEGAKSGSHTKLNIPFTAPFIAFELLFFEKHGKFLTDQETSLLSPDAVPLYLRNKSLLI